MASSISFIIIALLSLELKIALPTLLGARSEYGPRFVTDVAAAG
jgi:hypothetical protein